MGNTFQGFTRCSTWSLAQGLQPQPRHFPKLVLAPGCFPSSVPPARIEGVSYLPRAHSSGGGCEPKLCWGVPFHSEITPESTRGEGLHSVWVDSLSPWVVCQGTLSCPWQGAFKACPRNNRFAETADRKAGTGLFSNSSKSV